MNNITDLLKKTRVQVSPEIFTLLALRHEDWLKLLENPALSPRMIAPFMIFKDDFETTLLLDEIDFSALKQALQNARIEGNFRLLTFDVELDFSVYGFLAEISKILAAAEIPIVALSSFSRDHLLIKQNNLAQALKVLGKYIDDVC